MDEKEEGKWGVEESAFVTLIFRSSDTYGLHITLCVKMPLLP